MTFTKTIFAVVLSVAVTVQAQVQVIDTLAPLGNTYPTHDSRYGKGGWHSVTNLADVPVYALQEGMAAYEISSGLVYTRVGTNWVLLVTGSGGQSHVSLTNVVGITAVTTNSSTGLVVDAMAQSGIEMLLTNNIVMQPPTNAIIGRKLQWSITASNGDWSVTWPTNTFKRPTSSTMPVMVVISNGTESVFLIEYRDALPHWKLETYVWGY